MSFIFTQNYEPPPSPNLLTYSARSTPTDELSDPSIKIFDQPGSSYICIIEAIDNFIQARDAHVYDNNHKRKIVSTSDKEYILTVIIMLILIFQS